MLKRHPYDPEPTSGNDACRECGNGRSHSSHDVKCQCGHLGARHSALPGGRCMARRSVPGGRVYPCGCESYRPKGAKAKSVDLDTCSEACDLNRCVHDVRKAEVAVRYQIKAGVDALLKADLIAPATYRNVIAIVTGAVSAENIIRRERDR